MNKYDVYKEQCDECEEEQAAIENRSPLVAWFVEASWWIKTEVDHMMWRIGYRQWNLRNLHNRIHNILFKSYNKVKIKTLSNDWYDSDTLIIHSMFQILVNYVEKEKPFKHIDWEWDQAHVDAKEEILELYHWWKTNPFSSSDDLIWTEMELHSTRKDWVNFFLELGEEEFADQMRTASDPHAQNFFVVAERMICQKQNEMMKRLVDIRPFLWT